MQIDHYDGHYENPMYGKCIVAPAVDQSRDTLLELVGLIYQAGAEASIWPLFLERFCKAAGLEVASLGYGTPGVRGVHIQASYGVAEDYLTTFAEHYWSVDPWAPSVRERRQVGEVGVGTEFLPVPALKKTEMWAEWMRPQGLLHTMAAPLIMNEHELSAISAMNHRRNGEISADQVALLQLLMPHLQASLRIQRQTSRLVQVSEASLSGLNRANIGIIAFDCAGRVDFVSRLAHQMLSANDGLRVENGFLLAETIEQARLSELIHRASRPDMHPPGGILKLPRPSKARPYEVAVLPGYAAQPFTHAAPYQGAKLLLRDPERRLHSVAWYLVEAHGLTPRESEIAADLVDGLSLKEIAAARKISIETVRFHNKSIRRKMQCSTQQEIIATVLRSLATVDLSDLTVDD